MCRWVVQYEFILCRGAAALRGSLDENLDGAAGRADLGVSSGLWRGAEGLEEGFLSEEDPGRVRRLYVEIRTRGCFVATRWQDLCVLGVFRGSTWKRVFVRRALCRDAETRH